MKQIGESLDIGSVLKKIRENAGLSQRQMAKSLGIAYSTLNKYENGKRQPSAQFLIKLCEKFEFSGDCFSQITKTAASFMESSEDYEAISSNKDLKSKIILNLYRLDIEQLEFLSELTEKLSAENFKKGISGADISEENPE